MCPEPVVASCDSKTSAEVVDDSKDGSLPLQGSEAGHGYARERNEADESDLPGVSKALLEVPNSTKYLH